MIRISSPSCIRDLYADSSPLGGLGLFSSVDIARGTVIGFYTGEALSSRAYMQLPGRGQRDLYAITLPAIDNEPTILSPSLTGTGSVDPHRFPLACANEPPRKRNANMVVRVLILQKRDLQRQGLEEFVSFRDKTKLHCVAFVACRSIRAGEELTWHYGAGYDPHRVGYSVGKSCSLKSHWVSPLDVHKRSKSKPVEVLPGVLRRWNRTVPPNATDLDITSTTPYVPGSVPGSSTKPPTESVSRCFRTRKGRFMKPNWWTAFLQFGLRPALSSDPWIRRMSDEYRSNEAKVECGGDTVVLRGGTG